MALWTINAGDYDTHTVGLTYLYDLSTPGKYSAYAEVADPLSHVWLRTNTATFEMRPPSPSQTPSLLTVLVEDPSGAPIPGASVIVQHWVHSFDPAKPQHAVLDGIASVDDQGRITIHLTPGSYDVFVSEEAFVPIATSVLIYEARETHKLFTLKLQSGGGAKVEPSPK
jgi:hypothetical protein